MDVYGRKAGRMHFIWQDRNVEPGHFWNPPVCLACRPAQLLHFAKVLRFSWIAIGAMWRSLFAAWRDAIVICTWAYSFGGIIHWFLRKAGNGNNAQFRFVRYEDLVADSPSELA